MNLPKVVDVVVHPQTLHLASEAELDALERGLDGQPIPLEHPMVRGPAEQRAFLRRLVAEIRAWRSGSLSQEALRGAVYPLVLVLVAALWVAPALAQAPAAQCASTFPARLADAKQAVAAHEAWLHEHEKARPAVEWFEAHCHFLSELERAVRKLDDPNAFVCDPKAKGRPKQLTAELVLEHSLEPNVGSFQADQHHDLNNRCAELDQAARVGLVFGELELKWLVAHKLEVSCYGDDSERCVQARATIAVARAKEKR